MELEITNGRISNVPMVGGSLNERRRTLPFRRARERDEAAIQRWVKHTWPRVKKKPKS